MADPTGPFTSAAKGATVTTSGGKSTVTPYNPGVSPAPTIYTGPYLAGGQLERTTTSTPATASGTTDVGAQLQQLLASYGLRSLDSWLNQQLVSGTAPSAIPLLITQTPEFAQRFPGLAIRQQNGLPPMTPADYIAYEDKLSQLYRSAGLPQGFYDSPADVANLIGGNTSIDEMTSRVRDGVVAAQQAPPEVRQQLQTLYGIDQGHLNAFFLDPTTAEPIIMRKFQAAQAAGTAQLAGYGQLANTTAEHLASLGLSQGQLQQGFSTLGTEAQLFQGLPGTAEDNIGQEQQLGAQFEGNAADQLAILARQRQRQAAFQGGAQYQTTQTGTPGLGTVQRT